MCIPAVQEKWPHPHWQATSSAITNKACTTHHLERFNTTLRQRVARLVRETLAFSKKVETHIGAIPYFICDDNLMRPPALPL
jgi:IS1 family transposase